MIIVILSIQLLHEQFDCIKKTLNVHWYYYFGELINLFKENIRN